MIISEDNNENHIMIINKEEWEKLMLFKESCFEQMFDPESTYEMSQDAFVLLENIK